MFEGLEIQLAELILELLPIEIARNHYGLETAVADALKKFACAMLPSISKRYNRLSNDMEE